MQSGGAPLWRNFGLAVAAHGQSIASLWGASDCLSTCRERLLPDGGREKIMWYHRFVGYLYLCCWWSINQSRRRVKLHNFKKLYFSYCIWFFIFDVFCASLPSLPFCPTCTCQPISIQLTHSVILTEHCAFGVLVDCRGL